MLNTLKKFFAFCGADNRRLFVISIWLGVISAICSAMRIPAAAIVIQALTDNRNRTVGEVRSVLTRAGAQVSAAAVALELAALNGRAALAPLSVHSLCLI